MQGSVPWMSYRLFVASLGLGPRNYLKARLRDRKNYWETLQTDFKPAPKKEIPNPSSSAMNSRGVV